MEKNLGKSCGSVGKTKIGIKCKYNDLSRKRYLKIENFTIEEINKEVNKLFSGLQEGGEKLNFDLFLDSGYTILLTKEHIKEILGNES